MSDLSDSMKNVLATTFAFYLKSHRFHWNVEGPNFMEYHDFFSKVYTETFEAIDSIAEQIRALGEYAPGSFAEFHAFSDIEDETENPPAQQMFSTLISDNQKVMNTLNDAFDLANTENNQGLMNFLADRLDKHSKLGWMLKSFTK
jgi:starvation-inducible DNA-binding protein